MIGNKPSQLLNLAKQYRLLDEYVYFDNEIAYTEVARRMSASSALLLFSRYESLPCVVLEALCCGLPVISSSVGGIPEVIDESNGLLVNKDSVNDLVEAMQHMINNYSSYNNLNIAGRAATLYSYENVGKQIVSAYKSVLLEK